MPTPSNVASPSTGMAISLKPAAKSPAVLATSLPISTAEETRFLPTFDTSSVAVDIFANVLLAAPPAVSSAPLAAPPSLSSVALAAPPRFSSAQLAAPPRFSSAPLAAPPTFSSAALAAPPTFSAAPPALAVKFEKEA